MTAPTPTCQNLVMRERDGIETLAFCGKRSGVLCEGVFSCMDCTKAGIDEHLREHRARCEDNSARRGKA